MQFALELRRRRNQKKSKRMESAGPLDFEKKEFPYNFPEYSSYCTWQHSWQMQRVPVSHVIVWVFFFMTRRKNLNDPLDYRSDQQNQKQFQKARSSRALIGRGLITITGLLATKKMLKRGLEIRFLLFSWLTSSG